MGYAVRPLTRHRPSRAKRHPRFRLHWAPAGGSLAYVITMDETLAMTDSATVVSFGGAPTGGGVRPIRYTSPVRAM